MSLTTRDQAVLWHPYTQHGTAAPPLGIVRAEGALLYAEDGTAYLDGTSSWWVNLHGHSHPYIAEKVSEQLRTLEHVIFAGFTHEPAIQLVERLLPLLPGQARGFYSDNGSTAVEVALKMALQYHWNRGERQRRRIVVLEGSYHGDTFGAMAISERSVFTQPFWSLLFDVVTLPIPTPERADEAATLLEAAAAAGDVAAFIFEPLLLGTAGMLTYEAEALAQLLTICQRHGVLTIADEVFTGFGRTGKLFACDYLPPASPRPDIVCLSKGLTGGTMALGLTTCTAAIYEAFLSDDRTRAFFHGHSYTANPVACAAGLASLDLLLADACRAQIDFLTEQNARMAQELAQHPGVVAVRHLGTMLAAELATGRPTSYFSPLRDALYNAAIAQRVVLRPLGNVMYALPPYCTTPEQLAEIYRALRVMADLAAARILVAE